MLVCLVLLFSLCTLVLPGRLCSRFDADAGPLCVINASYTGSDSQINEETCACVNVQICDGVTIKATNSITILVPGNVTIGHSVVISGERGVTVKANQVTVQGGTELKSISGTVQLHADSYAGSLRYPNQALQKWRWHESETSITWIANGLLDDSYRPRISLQNVVVWASSVIFACIEGLIEVGGKSVLNATADNPLKKLSVSGHKVILSGDVLIAGPAVAIDSFGDLDLFAGTVQGLMNKEGDVDPLDSFEVFAGGKLVLGSGNIGGKPNWITKRFAAAAGGDLEMNGQTITLTDNYWWNRKTERDKRCQIVLENFPQSPEKGFPGKVVDDINETISDEEVSFDFVLVARGAIHVQSGSRVFSAALLMCAGGSLLLDSADGHGCLLDTSGRACGPGEGLGHGETNASWSNCAAGGSHLGSGGHGVSYGAFNAESCANAGQTTDIDVSGRYLPTESASGGGCGSTPEPCPHPGSSYSRGGGLIWLHGDTVTMMTDTKVRADGKQGKQLDGGESTSGSVSGGGSGGQVLIWTGALIVSKDQAASISASGGGALCSSSLAGGAGGGGFVGLGLLRDRSESDTQGLTVAVDSGVVDATCTKLNFPIEGEDMVRGKVGMTQGMTKCPKGHSGILCAPCAAGTWNGDGGIVCYHCFNKPAENSEYNEPGARIKECGYRCVPGVPSVYSNPDCLDVQHFLFKFFGGVPGLVTIAILVVLFILFIIWRRIWGKRRERASSATSWSHGSPGPIQDAVRSGRFDKCGIKLRCLVLPPSQFEFMHFTKDKLPYHICRVFLFGNNSTSKPWGLDEELPATLEEYISMEPWMRFVNEVNKTSCVNRGQRWSERVLKYWYPPLAPVHALVHRRERAERLCSLAQSHSRGMRGAKVVWKPIRGRLAGNSSAREERAGPLAMCFDCEDGATLGYIDFFDFDRDQLNWAPIDLRKEARIMVAHGHGTYEEPFALDAADPLLAHLAHMGFSEAAVYSVVATFNWTSRTVRHKELEATERKSLVLAHLKESVEICADRCGLSGLVQVVEAPMTKKLRLPLSAGALNLRSFGRGVGGGFAESSFSDLMPATSAASLLRQVSPSPGMQPQRSPNIPGINVPFNMSHIASISDQDRGISPYTKLALVFMERKGEPRSPSMGSAGCAPLTSPMPSGAFADQVLSVSRTRMPSNGMSEAARASCVRRYGFSALAGRIAARSSRNLATPATVILVCLLTAMALDVMMFAVMGFLMWKLHWAVFTYWIMMPPFAGPLAIVLGPLSIIIENPRVGRVFSTAQLTGIFTTWITLPVVLIVVPNSWEFYILYAIAITLVKVIVISCANAHITSLDSARDLSFVDAVQADAIYDILSGQVRPPQMARQESSNSESPWRRRERGNSLSSALPRSFQEPRSDFRFREDLVEIEKKPHLNESPVRFSLGSLDRLRSQSLSSDGLPDPTPIRLAPGRPGSPRPTEAPRRSHSKGPHEASPF